jgi:hypothetical protein
VGSDRAEYEPDWRVGRGHGHRGVRVEFDCGLASGPTGGGTSVTITGTNLTGASAVKFVARLAAQLRDGHPVEDRVDAAVTAGVVAVTDRLAGPLRGGSGQWRGAVEAAEAALGEPPRVADLD